MNDEKYIDELLRKFFDVDITTEEMDYLYSYFLYLFWYFQSAVQVLCPGAGAIRHRGRPDHPHAGPDDR